MSVVSFQSDYMVLEAHRTRATYVGHGPWVENRDASPCDLDPAPGPASNNTGNRDENIYADTLTVSLQPAD
jgi:hypothetical protein